MFDRNKLSRQDKIDFLKGLQAGTKRISEILPSRVIHFWRYDDDEIYFREPDKKPFTRDQIEEMEEKLNANNTYFTIHVMSTGIPIAHCEEDIVM